MLEPPPDERTDVPLDRMVELPLERTLELLLECTAGLLLLERVALGCVTVVELLRLVFTDALRFTVVVVRVALLPRVPIALLRVGALCVRVVTLCAREADAPRVVILAFSRELLVRVPIAVMRSFVRTFALLKVRDALVRVDTRVAEPRSVSPRVAIRVAIWRLRSISRALA